MKKELVLAILVWLRDHFFAELVKMVAKEAFLKIKQRLDKHRSPHEKSDPAVAAAKSDSQNLPTKSDSPDSSDSNG